MKINRTIRALMLVVLLAVFIPLVRADIPPPPGYKRVSNVIVLQTSDDLSGYRFFVVCQNLAKEISVEKGKDNTVSPYNAGARYRGGTIVAVPLKFYNAHGGNLDGTMLSDAIRNAAATGAVELIKDGFTMVQIRESEPPPKDRTYKLTLTDNKLKAEPVKDAGQSAALNSAAPDAPISDHLRGTSIIGGMLMAIAIGAFGIILFRRKRTAS